MNKRYLEKLQPIKRDIRNANKLSSSNTFMTNSNDTTKEDIDIGKKSQTRSNFYNEKIQINCESDKSKDEEFVKNLTAEEFKFYKLKYKEIYDFLLSINLLRFIDTLIIDGFENLNDLLTIEDDYFEENKAFNTTQQKKFIDSLNAIRTKKPETTEMGAGCNFLPKELPIKLCWSCCKKISSSIDKKYKNIFINKTLSFCSAECLQKFEQTIYATCETCKIKYDKSMGDYQYDIFHFHSKECLDKFIMTLNKGESYNSSSSKDSEDIYDPMEDF